MMKSLITIVLLMSICFTSHGQTSIGLGLGYSSGSLGVLIGDNEESINNFTIGLPINFTLSKRFDIRVSPTFIKYGVVSHYDKDEPIFYFATDGIIFYNSITTPVELRWKLINRNKFVASLNLGLGISFFTNGRIDVDLYTEDFFSSVVSKETIKENVDFNDVAIRRHSFNTNMGFDLGYRINETHIIGLHVNSIVGLSGLSQDNSGVGEIIVGQTIMIQFSKTVNKKKG